LELVVGIGFLVFKIVIINLTSLLGFGELIEDLLFFSFIDLLIVIIFIKVEISLSYDLLVFSKGLFSSGLNTV